jgi:hypothetical protein
MDGTTRVATIGAAALLALATVGGMVNAQSTDEGDATVLTLVSAGTIGQAEIGGATGERGSSTLLKEALLDADGRDAGTVVWHCANAEAVAWVCEAYLDLTAGGSTAEGSIVAQGLFEGFNGESLAVTGGTGAYADAHGDVTLSVLDDEFTWRLELLP